MNIEYDNTKIEISQIDKTRCFIATSKSDRQIIISGVIPTPENNIHDCTGNSHYSNYVWRNRYNRSGEFVPKCNLCVHNKIKRITLQIVEELKKKHVLFYTHFPNELMDKVRREFTNRRRYYNIKIPCVYFRLSTTKCDLFISNYLRNDLEYKQIPYNYEEIYQIIYTNLSKAT